MSEQTSRNLLSINDLHIEDLRELVRRGAEHAAGTAGDAQPLRGRVVGIYFRRTSTRTRTAFSVAALRLGAQIVSFGPDDLQENTGETAGDTAAVLARMLDALVARTAGSDREMRELGAPPGMAVVNAMSAGEHPTQALTDLTTMTRRFGGIDGLRVLYVGEGNNSAAALALALSRFREVTLELRTPPGYGLRREVSERAEASAGRTGSSVVERHDMVDLPKADVVYTTRWQTTGTAKADPDWRSVFAPFQVDEAVLDAGPDAVFLHDLPAHRGEEVTAAVLDGPRSLAFEQAENKLHSAKAVLEWCLPAPARGAR